MTSESVSQTKRPRLDWSAIRRFRPGDEDEILEVIVGGFEGWPWFELSVPVSEHLKWRLEGHKPSEARHWMVELDSRVVAVTVEAELDVKVGGIRRSLAIEGAASTLPEYQGRGVWSGMWNYRVENQRPLYDFTLTVSSNPIVLRGWERDPSPRLRMGNDIRVLMKVMDVRRAAMIHEEAGGSLQRNLLARLAAFAGLRVVGLLHTRPHRLTNPSTVSRVERFDERIDSFWEEASKPFDFIFERKCEFLNWRYCDPRAGKHAAFISEQDGKILGYIVVRTSSATRGQVLDLLALPGREDVVEELLDTGLSYLRNAGVASVHAWSASAHPYNEVLKRYGFVDSRKKLNFGWWLRPGADHSEFDFLRNPQAAVHIMEGEVLD